MWIALGVALAAPPTALVSLAADERDFDVRGLVVSPSGTVAAYSRDRILRLGSDVPPLELTDGDITGVDVSAQGWLVVANNGSVAVHGPDNRETMRLRGLGTLAGVAISSNGTRFALASASGVALHDAADGRELWRFEGQSSGVSFHPDGKRLVAGVPGGNVVLAVADGAVQTKFGAAPAMWFSWTDDRLWTRAWEEAPKAWNPVTFVAETAPVVEGAVSSAAVHPSQGWAVVDGCVHQGNLCPAKGATAARFDGAGALWIGHGGTLSRWFVPPQQAVRALGPRSDRPLVTGLAPDGVDWVVVGMDGTLRRLGPDGSVRFGGRVPSCGERDCLPVAVGARGGGAWVVGPRGLAMGWGPDGAMDGTARPTAARAAGRLADGRWVVLGPDDRARVGTKPGKGAATDEVPGARGLAVGPEAFVVIGDVVQPFDASGEPLPTPKLGPEVGARAVAISPDSRSLALVDDRGALHGYTLADGRAAYRLPHGLEAEGISLAYSNDGERLVTGGPGGVRVFSARDGSPELRALFEPGGVARRVASGEDGVGLVQGSAEVEQVLVLDVSGLIP